MPMFAYIVKADGPIDDETSDEFFRRFKSTPGLLHAYDLKAVDDPDDQIVVAIWEDRVAAEDYLNNSALRKEVDETISGVTRTMYEVRDRK
jgi:heme-degrading monooxygenase HmoA